MESSINKNGKITSHYQQLQKMQGFSGIAVSQEILS